jgi:hypothetical protein
MTPGLNGAAKRRRKAPPPAPHKQRPAPVAKAPPPPQQGLDFTMPLETFAARYIQPAIDHLARQIESDRNRLSVHMVEMICKEIRAHQEAITELLASVIKTGTENAKKLKQRKSER